MTIDAQPPAVKGRRRYDASGRRRRAEQSRLHLLDTAGRLFLAQGYPATTVATIAGEAGVSVETVYKAYGGKAGLVRALHQRALLGAGDVPAERRSDELARRASDPREVLRGWAALSTEVMPRVAPILLLVRAAAGADAEMAALRREAEDARLGRMTQNAAQLRRHLAGDVSLDRVRDVLFAYTAPELYEALVIRQGWSLAHYGDFVWRGLVASLLDPPPE
jgi:AcrR family transcriptional regulator